MARFSTESDHPVILARAYDCLLLATQVCGDFLLSRTVRDILPKLSLFLERQLDARLRYYQKNQKILNQDIKSVEYFAEKTLLQTLGQLMINLKLRSRDTWNVISVLSIYLVTKPIPKELRQCAFESLAGLAKYDSGSVRFYLHKIRNLFYFKQDNSGTTNFCDSCRDAQTDKLGTEFVNSWSGKFLISRFDGSLAQDLCDQLDRI